MKRIQKLDLGLLSIAILLVMIGMFHWASINALEADLARFAGGRIDKIQGPIHIDRRFAAISADVNRVLLGSVSGISDHRLELIRRIDASLAELDKSVAQLKAGVVSRQKLTGDENQRTDKTRELKAISGLEIRLQQYRNLIDNTIAVADEQGAQKATIGFPAKIHALEVQIQRLSLTLIMDAADDLNIGISEVRSSVKTSLAVITTLTLGAVALAVLIGVAAARRLVKRIQQPNPAAPERQPIGHAVEIKSADSEEELAEWIKAFNEMNRHHKVNIASIDHNHSGTQRHKRAETALQIAHDVLEARVRQRTRELEKAKIEAESANRTKSELLANMSHELRTPLNHIIGFTELIVGEKIGNISAMQKEYLTDALTSSHHLLALINDILDLSKVEADRLKLTPTAVDVQVLLNNCLVMFKEKAMKHRIELVLDAADAPETILADEVKIKQIVYHLLSNAFEFTPDAGQISVKAWQVDGNGRSRPKGLTLPGSDPDLPAWAISISDTGIGIAPEDLERIFKPFEKVSKKERSRQQGAGLGLTLTQRIVELHGGVIRAESNHPGQGATFTVMLPETVVIPAT